MKGQPLPTVAHAAPATVVEFVHQVYIYGVPFEGAKRYTSSADVKRLADLLHDKSEEPYWPNIAVTSGMIGTPDAAQQLAALVGRDEETLSPTAYRTKRSAVIAVLRKNLRQSECARVSVQMAGGFLCTSTKEAGRGPQPVRS